MISRALIVRHPYAGRLVRGVKTWEMRSRPTSIRERIGIIEAGSGHIIGEVDLVGCLGPIKKKEARVYQSRHMVDDLTKLEKWPYAWVMENAEMYKDPVPYHHPKGAVIWVSFRFKAFANYGKKEND